ncbi:rhodanese-like domain-containing protein [Ammoniphilus sp. YIM 78166]|uniref:rhodanese-like domain-containing protein n=1 Tax=Ammoniphilus sp. YIM 78166 TaxID=1644106 RepID=UPI00106FA73E|nr:rhodanese-like domain-containing protein [Ammoniphilus sp. YIM 78166]
MSEEKGWKEVSPQEVEKWIKEKKDIQFVDVREVEEFEAGHIEGVTLIPLSEFGERMKEIDLDKETVFICRSGARSGRVCEYLSSLGNDKTYNMVGGMLNWTGDVKRGL